MKIHDGPCPSCGPHCKSPVNRARKVFRTWQDGNFTSYKCARCGVSGYSHAKLDLPYRQPVAPVKDRSAIASWLWKKSLSMKGTMAEAYLRSRQCLTGTDNIRFIPAFNQHHACMIARFGTHDDPACVHLTKLVDGHKAGTEKDKIIIGSSQEPIILSDNAEGDELIATEGIEDAASIALATGWTCWAAGSASRLPSIIPASSFRKVFVIMDDDSAGRLALKRALGIRKDIIAVNFSKTIEKGIDANKALIKYGKDAILASLNYREIQSRHACGEIGFHAMEREMRWANEILGSLR